MNSGSGFDEDRVRYLKIQVRHRTVFQMSSHGLGASGEAGGLDRNDEKDLIEHGSADGFTSVRRMLDALPIPVVISKPPELRLRYANEAAATLFGYPREQPSSTSISDLTAPGFRHEIPDLAERLQVRGGIAIDKCYLHADGSEIHTRSHIAKMPGFEHLNIAVIADVSALNRVIERAGMLSIVAALVSNADGGLDEVASVVEGLGGLHLGARVVVDWLPVPDFFGSELPKVVYSESSNEYWCAIVAAGSCLGSIKVLDPVEVSDELGLAVESLAHCLAGAASVHRLTAELDATELFERAFESSNVGMTLVSSDERFIRVNEAFAKMVGRSADELSGLPWHSVVHPGDVESDEVMDFRRSLREGREDPLQHTRRYLRPDRTVVWGSVSLSPIFTAGSPSSGVPDFYLSHIVDVSQQVRALREVYATKQALRDSEIRYRSLVEPTPDAVLRLDADGQMIEANLAAQRLFDVDVPPETDPTSIDDILPGEVVGELRRLIDVVFSTRTPAEIPRQRLDVPERGESWFRIRVLPEGRGSQKSVHVVIIDISNVVENERRLMAMELTDLLTGIPNRAAILDRLEHAMERLHRGRSPGVAVAAVNLDNFKSVNESFGHEFGDRVLSEFAERIGSVLRSEDSVGRLGSDEFLIVVEDVPSALMAEDVAERLSDSLNPLIVSFPDGHETSLTASLGMAWVSSPEPADDVVGAANRALRDAKREGRARMWSSIDTAATGSGSTRSLPRELMAAIDNDEFVLHYQPIVDARRHVCGVEALIRWEHPTRGLLGPDQFIHSLISTGQIGTVGAWVLERSIRQLDQWDADGVRDLSLHVNASPAELAHPAFRSRLRDALSRYPVDPRRLSVEVTEQALAGTIVSTSVMQEIAGHGARIVLDDFGTGISSLTHLRAEPLHEIKIDRSFVSHSAPGDVNRRIVEGVVGLARGIGVAVTAEGVETDEQAEWIESLGVEQQQGYFFGRPMSADRLADMVRRERDENDSDNPGTHTIGV